MKEAYVRKMEALRLIELIKQRLDYVEWLLKEEAYPQAEAEILIAKDLVESLKTTIRRLERL